MTPRIAILPWGDAIEDFLAPHRMALEDLRDTMSGGWLFGYAEALETAGAGCVIACVSESVTGVERWRHAPTGTPLLVLPLPRAARALRARGGRARLLAPYAATPVRTLGAELRRAAATAILCQEYEYERFDVLVHARRVHGLPVHATFQGGDVVPPGLRGRIREGAIARGGRLVIGPAGEAERAARVHRVAPGRIARIPNPLEPGPWAGAAATRPAARAGLRLPDGAVVVAWHGRVDLRRKGLDVLADTWRLLRDRDDLPERRLLLVGTGADTRELHERLGGLDDVVHIDEYVLDKHRVAALLSAADLYAFPSRHEGFPVAPLEAMALGLPVVAADAPGVAEILGDDGGVLVPREDPAALAGALARLLSDAGARSELGQRGRARALAGFAPAAIGARLRTALAGIESADEGA